MTGLPSARSTSTPCTFNAMFAAPVAAPSGTTATARLGRRTAQAPPAQHERAQRRRRASSSPLPHRSATRPSERHRGRHRPPQEKQQRADPARTQPRAARRPAGSVATHNALSTPASP